MNVRHLSVIEEAPVIEAGPSLRIAIATQDLRALNAHFGSAKRFAIYDVTPDSSRFLSAVSFDDVTEESGQHKTDGDDRIGADGRCLQPGRRDFGGARGALPAFAFGRQAADFARARRQRVRRVHAQPAAASHAHWLAIGGRPARQRGGHAPRHQPGQADSAQAGLRVSVAGGALLPQPAFTLFDRSGAKPCRVDAGVGQRLGKFGARQGLAFAVPHHASTSTRPSR